MLSRSITTDFGFGIYFTYITVSISPLLEKKKGGDQKDKRIGND